MRNCAAIAIASLAVLPNAYAAEEMTRRPCTHADIVGTWDMLDLKANFKYDDKNAWYFPYQIMMFDEDGTLRHWTSTTMPDGMEKKLLGTMKKSQTYKLDDSNGHLNTVNTATHASVNYTCMIYVKDSGINKKGEMLLATGNPRDDFVIKVLEKEGKAHE